MRHLAEVPPGSETHFFVPFEVPAGTVEIEIRHDDLSSANILDWGLDDPSGFRGWGGGNSEPAIVGEQAASRSYIPGPMPAGTWEVVVGKARIDEPPGQYRIEIERLAPNEVEVIGISKMNTQLLTPQEILEKGQLL